MKKLTIAVLTLMLILTAGCNPQGGNDNQQEVDTFKIKTITSEVSFKEISEADTPYEGTDESCRAEYARDGKLLKEVFYTDEYERTVTYVYQYGRLVMTKLEVSPDPYYQNRVFEYDEEGRLVKESNSMDSEDVFKYIYSEDGQKIVRQHFITPDGGVAYENRYAYDDKGRVIADSVYSIRNEEESIPETVFNELTEYQYDDQDRVVKETNCMPSMGEDSYFQTITYQYLDIDEHGNWRTKIEHSKMIDQITNPQRTITTKRTIEYYE